MRGVAILSEIAVKKRHEGGKFRSMGETDIRRKNSIRVLLIRTFVKTFRRFEKQIIGLIGNEGPFRMSPTPTNGRFHDR